MAIDWHGASMAVLHHPLFNVAITLGTYQLAMMAYEKMRWMLFQPMLVAILLTMALLLLLDIPYEEYRQGTTLLTLFLGPATVALAVPLYLNLKRIRELLVPILATLLLGGLGATLGGFTLAWLFGVDGELLMSMLTKSVTSPIAMLVADQIGGAAALASAFVMVTGICGAMFGPELLRLLRIRHPEAIGVALGISAHAVGTTRALQESDEAGAFAALSMSVMGVVTAVATPMLVQLLT